jgi:hypothetical protein
MSLKSTGIHIIFKSPTIPMFLADLMNCITYQSSMELRNVSVTDDDVDYTLEHFIENVDKTNEF